jgi:hypothetical protein
MPHLIPDGSVKSFGRHKSARMVRNLRTLSERYQDKVLPELKPCKGRAPKTSLSTKLKKGCSHVPAGIACPCMEMRSDSQTLSDPANGGRKRPDAHLKRNAAGEEDGSQSSVVEPIASGMLLGVAAKQPRLKTLAIVSSRFAFQHRMPCDSPSLSVAAQTASSSRIAAM